MQSTFFKDLVVVELASVLAGPAVGMFFAELGARVIKIENKTSDGDMTRRWKVKGEDASKKDSAYYRSVNWGKEVLFLDLKEPSDLQQLHELVTKADVVINNFKPESVEKLGVAYTQLKTLNPKLIFAQLTAFGEESNRLGFDVVLQAEAGFLHMNGEPNGASVKMPVALIDLLAAHQLKEGILLALLHRYKSGKGSYIHASLLEAAVASLANQATNWLIAQHIPQKMGMEHPNIAPYGDVFFTKDQKAIVLAVGTDKQFGLLCKLLEIPHLIEDSRFQSNDARVKNRVALKVLLQPLFEQYLFQPFIEKIHQLGIPAGQIRNMKEVFEQPLAKEMILKYEDGTPCVRGVAFSIKS
ncbi:MAG: CoA transferase [Bacteroidota bacterium]